MKFKLFGWTIIIEKEGFDHKYAEQRILEITLSTRRKIPPIKWVRDYSKAVGCGTMSLYSAKRYVEAIWVAHGVTYQSLKETKEELDNNTQIV